MRFESLSGLDDVFGGFLCRLLSAAPKPPVASPMAPPRHVMLVKLRGIGDTVLALPMVRALKERGTRVTFVTGPDNAGWLSGQELVDDLVTVDFQRVWRSPAFLPLLRRLRGLGADACIDLTQSANFPVLLGLASRAAVRVGFANRSRRKRRRNRLYTHAVAFSGREHMAACYFDLLGPFGIPRPEPLRLVAPCFTGEDVGAVDALLGENGGAPRKLAGIHASGAIAAKRWPLPGWVALCRDLADRGYGVIAVGAAGERPAVDRIASALAPSSGRLINAAGRLTLNQVFALMPRLRLFIANDGGPMHIAAAAGVPTLGLFGPELPRRYSPLNDASRALYRGGHLPCSPCSRPYEGSWPTCRRPLCMEAISDGDVLGAVQEMEMKIPPAMEH